MVKENKTTFGEGKMEEKKENELKDSRSEWKQVLFLKPYPKWTKTAEMWEKRQSFRESKDTLPSRPFRLKVKKMKVKTSQHKEVKTQVTLKVDEAHMKITLC